MLALAQYPGAPGIGFVFAFLCLAAFVSAMFALWGKEGAFYDSPVWKKVLLTIAIVALPFVVLLVLTIIWRP